MKLEEAVRQLEEVDRKLQGVVDNLKYYANNWEVAKAEDGEQNAKKAFVGLVKKAIKLGAKNVVRKFPDGKRIPGVK